MRDTGWTRMTGGGFQCRALARAWGCSPASSTPTPLDAAIFSWGGAPETEFVAPKIDRVLVARALTPFRSENVVGGKRQARICGVMSRERSVVLAGGFDLRSVNQPGEVLHIYLATEAVEAAFEAEGRAGSALRADLLTDDRTLRRLGDVVASELHAPGPRSALFDETLAVAIAVAVTRASGVPSDGATQGGLATWTIRRCTEFLHANLARNVSLSELAEVAQLSPFHFARMFKRSLGVAPHAYHRRLRIDKARALLLSTDLSVGDVAAAVGYKRPQAFSRVFRQVTGQAPATWRRTRRA